MSKTKTVGGEGKEINVVHNVGLIERLEQVGIKTMLTACTGVMAVCLTIAGYFYKTARDNDKAILMENKTLAQQNQEKITANELKFTEKMSDLSEKIIEIHGEQKLMSAILMRIDEKD